MAMAVIVAMLVAPLAVSPALAGPIDDAREHYQRGNQLYQSGDYRGAIREFAEADRLAPSPILGFNIALCHDRMGNADEAIRRYREYLKAVPKADNRAAVEASIERLEAARGAAKEGTSATEGAANEGTEEPGAEAGTPPAPTASTYTGSDPGLKRVAAIDVSAMRARYRGGEGSEAASAGAAGTEPGAAGQQPPQASEDQSDVPPPTSPPVSDAPSAPKTTPIYKKWWFWVVLGVGAIIVINLSIESSGSSNNQPLRGLLTDPAATLPDSSGGATLWRF